MTWETVGDIAGALWPFLMIAWVWRVEDQVAALERKIR